MKRAWFLLGSAAVGFGLTALGCGQILGLDGFTDKSAGGGGAATGGGGSGTGASGGGTGAAGGGGSGSGASGGGGSGGGALVPSCALIDAPFEIFGAAEVQGGEPRSDGVQVLFDPSSSHAHVIAVTSNPTRVLARSVRSSDQMGSVVLWPSMPLVPGFTFGHAFVAGNKVLLPGAVGSTWGHVEIATNSGKIESAQEMLFESPVPIQCGTPPGINSMAGYFDGTTAWIAGSCDDNTTLGAMQVWQSSGGGGMLLVGGPNDPKLTVRAYARMGNAHVFFTGTEAPGAEVSSHVLAYENADISVGTLDFVHTPGKWNILSAAGPRSTVEGAGVFLFAGVLTPNTFLPGDLYGGTLGPEGLDAFLRDPKPALKFGATWSTSDEFATFSHVQPNVTGNYFTAGSTETDPKSRVLLLWWGPGGEPRVLGFPVETIDDPATGGRHFQGSAAGADVFTQLVAWWYKTPGGEYSVRGQMVNCQMVPE